MFDEARQIARLKSRARALPYATDDALRAIKKLGTLDHPHAIRALTVLLALPGARGQFAMHALIARGLEVEDAMERALQSSDPDRAWRAHHVLAALHDDGLRPGER